jgi:hypothetical protein
LIGIPVPVWVYERAEFYQICHRVKVQSINVTAEAECLKWNGPTSRKHVKNLGPWLSTALDVFSRDLPSRFL